MVTTQRPEIEIADESQQPPVPLPTPGRITFLGLSRHTATYEEVFKRYCPIIKAGRIPDETRLELGLDAVDDDVYVRDPDVLWVGRLLDGFVYLGVVDSRSLMKNFLKTVTSGRDSRPPGLPGRLRGGGEVSCTITPVFRVEMAEAHASGKLAGMDQEIQDKIARGESPEIALGEAIKHNEPGEIRNSPPANPSGKLSEAELDDMWAAQMAAREWEPSMRLDSRFGLHYLKRGDRIFTRQEGFPKPNTPYTENTWIPRPPSEGPSLISAPTGEPGVVDLR